MAAFRTITSNYIKKQITEQPDSVILFLCFYVTTEGIRKLLSDIGIAVKELERNGSMILLDIMKVLQSPFFEVSDIERLRELVKKIESHSKDRCLNVIADMSVFNHIKKSRELLEYEKNLHRAIQIERWKELCLYHIRDFETMFSDEERNGLLKYHKGKVITISN